jgi:hypothetical protein
MLTVGRRRLDGGRSEAEAFRRWSGSKRAADRGWGARVEAEVVDVPPCRDRRWRWLELDLDKTKGCVRSREARGSQRCREEGRRRPAGDGNLPLLLELRRCRSPSAEREGEQGLARWALGGGERWMGVNGVEPVAQTLGLGLKRVGVDAVCGGSRRTRLARVAVLRGRRRRLIPVMQARSSGMCCIGRG